MNTELPPNSELSHYRIISKIGAGGMGEVYLAKDQKLDRRVAIKILQDDIGREATNLSRFVREAKAASALSHPNILVIYEVGETDGRQYIVSEFIDGETLRTFSRKSPLSTVEVLDIAIQVASALCAAHEARIVHRDIKPENIMVGRDGFVKILDFGLAKLIGEKPPFVDLEDETAQQSLTGKGFILGTVKYMSPEQAKGEAVDARTDIFSLGVVIYEMVAGRLPFDAESVSETITKLLRAEPQPLARFSATVPEDLQRIVSKMLRKSRDERYQTMKGLLVDLKDLRDSLAFGERLERSHASESENETRQYPPVTEATHKETTETRQPTFSRKITKHNWTMLAGAAVLLFGFAIGAYLFFFTGSPIHSVAVLPFENGSNDASLEYLSDGLSESLIDRLAQLPQLRVTARNSSFSYKGKQNDLTEIGRALGVRAIVTGRVVQRGDNLNVRVEMVDVNDNRQLWSEQYDRKMADFQAVQQDIAETVSEKLRLRLTGAEQKSLARPHTNNAQAYQLYLKCNFFWNKFTPEAERTAIDLCSQAIVEDPSFGLPYAGLVHAYQVSANNGWMRPHDAYPKAKAAIARAIELDPNNPSLLTAVASTAMFYDWDWAAAERGFKRANEVEPNYWHHHELYAYLLTLLGRSEEAIAEAKRAQDIDPLSLIGHASAGHTFYFSRQYDGSREQIRKALALDPNFPLGHAAAGRVLVEQGKYQEAIDAYLLSFRFMGRNSQYVAELGRAYALSGNRTEALKILDELNATSKNQYVAPLDMAILYIGLGDKEQALAHLEKAYDERSTWLMWIKVDPRLDPLRGEPRFQDLLRRMNLA